MHKNDRVPYPPPVVSFVQFILASYTNAADDLSTVKFAAALVIEKVVKQLALICWGGGKYIGAGPNILINAEPIIIFTSYEPNILKVLAEKNGSVHQVIIAVVFFRYHLLTIFEQLFKCSVSIHRSDLSTMRAVQRIVLNWYYSVIYPTFMAVALVLRPRLFQPAFLLKRVS